MLLSKSWLVFWASCFLFTRVTLPFANIRNKGGMCQPPATPAPPPAHLRCAKEIILTIFEHWKSMGTPEEFLRKLPDAPRDDQAQNTQTLCVLKGVEFLVWKLKDLFLKSNKTLKKPCIFNQRRRVAMGSLHRCTWHTSAFWSFVPLLKIRIKGIKGCQSLRCLGRRSFWGENLWTFLKVEFNFGILLEFVWFEDETFKLLLKYIESL